MKRLVLSLLVLVVAPGMLASRGAQAQPVTLVSKLMEEAAVQPGQRYERTLVLTNVTDRPQPVRIVQADYASGLGGRTEFLDPDTLPRSNASWVSLPRSAVVIPPDSTVSLPYVVVVPPPGGEPLEGTFWSVLMVEMDPGAPVESSAGRVNLHVRHAFRYAVHVVTQVGGGAPAIEIARTELVNEPGARALRVDVRNAGSRVVRPEPWLEVYEGEGDEVGRLDGSSPLVYPGQEASLQIPLSDLSEGDYTALLYVEVGQDDLIGMRLNLSLSEPVTETSSTATPSARPGEAPRVP